jgi:hypothetical protein
LLEKYVNVFEDIDNNKVYGYTITEFSDPTAIINLAANPSKFINTEGWIGEDLVWGLYPKFTSNTDLSTYTSTSYLKVKTGYTYNFGISSNK